jgi:hypothetical protein
MLMRRAGLKHASVDRYIKKLVEMGLVIDKRYNREFGDSAGAQYIFPSDDQPSVTITEPDDLEEVEGTVSITATASCSDTISNVKYRIATWGGFVYDSGWVTMTKSGGSYTGSWDSSGREGYFWLTVRAESSSDIYGYDAIIIEVLGD